MAASKDYEQLIFHPKAEDLKEFEEIAAAAKDAGFTHVFISDLSERVDYRGEDADSPWCEWSVNFASVFKHAPPPGLGDAFPKKWVKRQMDFMKAKHEIAEKLGLRCAYHGLEPHWLPERIYAEHPQWRGGRCDNSLRTTGMYFAVDVDNEEVRALYREAMKTIVTECPLLDVFVFHTNDCGAGYPWEGRLYVNPNGPTDTLGGDMGLRVAGFLKTLRQGAADGGVDARVFSSVYNWFTPDETHLVIRSLEPGIGLLGTAPGDLAAECSLGGAGGWGDQVIDGYPRPMGVVRAVRNIKKSPAVRFQASGGNPDYFTAFKVAMAEPAAETPRQRLDLLEKIAAALYADDVVDDVLEAWERLQKSSVQEGTAGIKTFLGPVMLRWLVRPMVPHQKMLTEAERSYWEPYIYQSAASQPESYLDYLNGTGKPMAATWDEATPKCIAVDGIEATLKSAAAVLEKAAEKTSSKDAAKKLVNDARRIRAKASVYLTVRHFFQMGTLIYERDRDNARAEKAGLVDPAVPDLSQGSMGSHGLFFMFRAMRWELDNTNELIRLIEESPVPLIVHTGDKAREGAFIMGPDLLDGLKKKVAAMVKYWRTAEKGYYLPTKGG